ncbi:MAG: hypothetical protein R3Y45_07990 [Bacillota bacterium]
MKRVPTMSEYVQNYRLCEQIQELKEENERLIKSNLHLYELLQNSKNDIETLKNEYSKTNGSMVGKKFIQYFTEEEKKQYNALVHKASARGHARGKRSKDNGTN